MIANEDFANSTKELARPSLPLFSITVFKRHLKKNS